MFCVLLKCYKTFPVRSVKYNLGIWEFCISSAEGNSPAVEREDTESDWCWGCHGDGSYGMVTASLSRRESSLSLNRFRHTKQNGLNQLWISQNERHCTFETVYTKYCTKKRKEKFLGLLRLQVYWFIFMYEIYCGKYKIL